MIMEFIKSESTKVDSTIGTSSLPSVFQDTANNKSSPNKLLHMLNLHNNKAQMNNISDDSNNDYNSTFNYLLYAAEEKIRSINRRNEEDYDILSLRYLDSVSKRFRY